MDYGRIWDKEEETNPSCNQEELIRNPRQLEHDAGQGNSGENVRIVSLSRLERLPIHFDVFEGTARGKDGFTLKKEQYEEKNRVFLEEKERLTSVCL